MKHKTHDIWAREGLDAGGPMFTPAPADATLVKPAPAITAPAPAVTDMMKKARRQVELEYPNSPRRNRPKK